MKYLNSILVLFLMGIQLVYPQKPQEKPNVVLIYADDLGRGMLGTYGQQIVETPNIDKLAIEGIRFENAYGAMYCAPARASLLTGMHDCHGGGQLNMVKSGIYKRIDVDLTFKEVRDKVNGVRPIAVKDEVFLGQIAQKVGYKTGQFGKLGWGSATTPERVERQGWDEHFGYYDHTRCHGFYPPFLFENGKKIDINGNTHPNCSKTPEFESSENYKNRWNMDGKKIYSENIIMDRLLSFLDRNNPKKTKEPFFLYFPTQLPHGPVSITKVYPEFKNNPNLTEIEKEYASMVKMLDDDVGRIYKKLEELEILENTIIVFTADNGHEIYYPKEGRTSKGNKNVKGETYDNIETRFNSKVAGDIFDGNDGMSGKKRDNWEGGTRVPLFWYWKNKIQSNKVTNHMVSNYDFLNTLSELIGGNQREEKDGISYAKILFGKECEQRDYTVYSSKLGPAIVTKDGWKLRYATKKDVFQLYYLPNDYEELVDLSIKENIKLENLKETLYNECDNDWRNGYGPQQIKIQ